MCAEILLPAAMPTAAEASSVAAEAAAMESTKGTSASVKSPERTPAAMKPAG